ncbi:MAG: hypothetical protein LBO73_00895 [Holosporaceae bacterium]|jgi:hypothetical protein|nr:hypothetical protein [Holosporaceae bacterium]
MNKYKYDPEDLLIFEKSGGIFIRYFTAKEAEVNAFRRIDRLRLSIFSREAESRI